MSSNLDVLNALGEMAPGWAAAQNIYPYGSGNHRKPLYLSTSEGGQVDDISYSDEDILVFDQCTSTWSLYFDGSDVGLENSDVNAFHVLDDGQILLSLNDPKTLNSIEYDDSDIIRFKLTSLGSVTDGSFHIYFDGSDVQLTKNVEDIDAIVHLGNGGLAISTLGTANVDGATAKDEDLLHFYTEQLGKDTKGTWSHYLDGSDIKLNDSNDEDISAAWIDKDDPGIYLSTYKNYSAIGSDTSQDGDAGWVGW